jgi:hypothetical protein
MCTYLPETEHFSHDHKLTNEQDKFRNPETEHFSHKLTNEQDKFRNLGVKGYDSKTRIAYHT